MNTARSAPQDPPPRNPARLTGQRFDVLIIGGGINGAGLARDLTLRGLRVALAEKADFASGTSSASTKLVHGGLRYLENLDFRLVFESCRERRILSRIAPHLVRPIPFFIPVYRNDPRSLGWVRAGMTLYDLLALFRNTRRHDILSGAAARDLEPALREADLTGVARYWDCRMDDARLCLENLVAAREGGAEVVNYLEVTDLLRSGGRVRGARLRDLESDAELEVEAEVVVNTAGPWLDRIRAMAGDGEAKLRPTRGTHILVPRINRGEEALYLTAGRDDRLFFVIPWGGLSLIGTTDVDFPGDPDTVAPTAEDIDYLLEATGRHLQDTRLSRSQVVAAFAGLRPLVAENDSAGGASQVSREHRIFESSKGLLSVGGGKYTTYRAIVAEVARRVSDRLGRGQGRSITHRLPLPGGVTGRFETFVRNSLPHLSAEYGLPPAALKALLTRYGSRTADVLAVLKDRPDLAHPVVPGSPLLALQVVYAVNREMARTPEDVLRRRTSRALEPGRGLAELPAVAEIMGDLLGVGKEGRRRWRQAYEDRYAAACPPQPNE